MDLAARLRRSGRRRAADRPRRRGDLHLWPELPRPPQRHRPEPPRVAPATRGTLPALRRHRRVRRRRRPRRLGPSRHRASPADRAGRSLDARVPPGVRFGPHRRARHTAGRRRLRPAPRRFGVPRATRRGHPACRGGAAAQRRARPGARPRLLCRRSAPQGADHRRRIPVCRQVPLPRRGTGG